MVSDVGEEDTLAQDPELDRLRAVARARLFGDGGEPDSIGRYGIRKRLGAGGMGVVYLAHDEDLDRDVAVKVVRPDASEGTAGRARLVREAQVMAKLSHPNVVHVYEVGRQDELVYIAMEFIPGVTLREWSQQDRPAQEIVELHLQAARGLAAAHDAGLVHRDYKPENVLVGGDGRARVLDFGLARPQGLAEQDTARVVVGEPTQIELTATGALLGTPAYMAPEQLQGRLADARADQFAFCVGMFEALYGRRPFSGASFAELSEAVLEGTPAPVDRAESITGVHAALLRGLSVDPADRFASMHALIDALESAPRKRRSWPWLSAVGLAVVGAAAFVASRPAGDETNLLAAPHDPKAEILAASKLPKTRSEPVEGDPYGVTVHRLSNGLSVFISQDHASPQLSAGVAFRVGSIDDPEGATGVTALIAHLMGGGTSRLGVLDPETEGPLLARRDALLRELEETRDDARRGELIDQIGEVVREGAVHVVPNEHSAVIEAFGGESNAMLTETFSVFYAEIPSARFSAWAALEAERFERPAFRGFFAALASVGGWHDSVEAPELVIQRALWGGTPWQHGPSGDIDDLARPPFSAMLDVYRNRFVPNNAAIILAGDIDPQRALPVLEEAFGHWEPAALPERPSVPEALPLGRKDVELPANAAVPFAVGWRGHAASPGADMQRQLASAILELSLQRLMAELCARVRLAATTSTSVVSFQPKPGVEVDAVEAAFFEALRTLRADGPEPTVVAEVRSASALRKINDARAMLRRVFDIASTFGAGFDWADTAKMIQPAVEPDPSAVQREIDAVLDGGYVVLRRGETPSETDSKRVPSIGAVEYAEGRLSRFSEELLALPVASLEPQFLHRGRQYTATTAGETPVFAVDVDDGLSSLIVAYPVGASTDAHACNEINLWLNSGTEDRTYDALREHWAQLGVQVWGTCDAQISFVEINALDSGIEEAWPSVLTWLTAPKPRAADLERIRARWVATFEMIRSQPSEQDDAALDYALYGAGSFYLSTANSEASQSVSLKRLRDGLAQLRARRPTLLYSGRSPRPELPNLGQGEAVASTPMRVQPRSAAAVVWVADAGAEEARVQIAFTRGPLDPRELLLADLLVEYLQGGVTGLLYEELRTSRAIATYSSARVREPASPTDDHPLVLEFGGPARHTVEAIEFALSAARRDIDAERFEVARRAVEARYRGRRVPPQDIPGLALRWRARGFESDPLLEQWPALSEVDAAELQAFAKTITARPPVIIVQAPSAAIESLDPFGAVERVDLDTIFGM